MWKTKMRWKSAYSADSVEWCPVEPYTDILVCGTYQLDISEGTENQQKRLGKIYLFRIEDDKNLSPIQTVETTGILDQKWSYHPINGCPVLAVVTSDGFLQLYKLETNNETVFLTLWKSALIGQNLLVLSVDWSTNKFDSDPRLVVSDSGGNVTVFDLNEELVVAGLWSLHSFEVWIGAFDYWNRDVFYSGGDDCIFRRYDVRIPEIASATNKSHQAGVTSIRSHVNVEHQLITGSYDETIRLWDARKLKNCITEQNVGGGVWRLKWHQDKQYILAACMYGGFRILKLEDGLSVCCEYMEHESIAYGVDWNTKGQIASCSFYDCSMHVSDLHLTDCY